METPQKILIVDDKLENLFSLRQVLSETGAAIIEASSGNEALIASLNHEFALAILDVQMPDMNGYELAEFLRSEQKTRELPIIFVSAVYSSDYHVFKGYESGAVDFLVKPFDPRILISKAKVFLQLSYQQADLKTAKERIERQYNELRASESRFESLVLTVPDIVYRIDTTGCFTFVNDAIKKLGYIPADLLGKHFSTVILPSDVNRVSWTPAVTEQRTGGEPYTPIKLFDERRTGQRKTTGLEIRLIPKKGPEAMTGVLEQVGDETVVVEINSAGLYSDKPNARNRLHLGTVGVIRDISDRKKMEDQLRLYNEELGKRVSERTRMLTEKNRMLVDEIKRRKAAEDSMRKAKREWEEIFDAIGQMAAIMDTNYRLLAVNRSIIQKTGLSKQELIGKKCHEIFHKKDKLCSDCLVSQQRKSRESTQNEMEVDILGGSYILSCTPVFDESGNLLKLIHIWTDITQRKTLENELIHAHKMEAIGTLAGGIAHDFNNILSALIGFAELARRDAEKGSVLEDDLTEILNCGLRAKDLVRQILTFARQAEEKFSEIHVDYIVKEVVKFIRSTIPTTIEITSTIHSKSMILANATQIHQVLMNLCTNAAHAMKEQGGLLHVSLRDVMLDRSIVEQRNEKRLAPGNHIELVVSDTGTGIEPGIIEKIFEPYFTTKELGEGTGMGLAVVQGIINDVGGTITVTSRIGQGTVFTILIPVSHGKNAESTEEDQRTDFLGNEHILFIDDEPAITKVGKRVLEGSGYTVTVINKPDQALALFKENPESYDLIVTDLTMPKMTGGKLVEHIKEIRPEIPVILCTGYSKKELLDVDTRIRFNAIVHKPIERDLLVKTVRKVLDET